MLKARPIHAGYPDAPQLGCRCEACAPMDFNKPETVRMIVCATCGNKRCPHATNHLNACTNSNEPGQPGSSYAHIPRLVIHG